MKVGVCIKYYHRNYGGMLQSFATIKYFEKLGLDCEIIRYQKKYNVFEKIKFIPRLLNNILLNDKIEELKKQVGLKMHPDVRKNELIRKKAFNSFCEANFTNFSPVYVGYKELSRKSTNYDAIITGSDQLWSPAGLPTNFYNLKFVDDSVRKISYASSFGVSYIPWYQKRRTADFLRRIDSISMREIQGAELVKHLIGKEVISIIDPVFNFSCDEWIELIPVEKKYEEKYVFAYFLGSESRYRDEVIRYAKEYNYKIVTLKHLDQYVPADKEFGDYSPYDVSPSDFLNLIRGAERVFTDSFHGACFSIINQKKFMIFNRYSDGSKHSKNSRIETLCRKLGLGDRRYDGCIFDVDNNIDYIQVLDKIENMRKQSEHYIKDALQLR